MRIEKIRIFFANRSSVFLCLLRLDNFIAEGDNLLADYQRIFMKKLLVFLSFLLTTSLFAGQVFYVVSGGAGKKDGISWANAYADVQTAIDKA